jgi:hypothetical protein
MDVGERLHLRAVYALLDDVANDGVFDAGHAQVVEQNAAVLFELTALLLLCLQVVMGFEELHALIEGFLEMLFVDLIVPEFGQDLAELGTGKPLAIDRTHQYPA